MPSHVGEALRLIDLIITLCEDPTKVHDNVILGDLPALAEDIVRQAQEADRQWKTLEHEVTTLRKEKHRARSQLDSLETDLAGARSQVAELQSQVKHECATRDALQLRVQDLEASNASLKKEVADVRLEHAASSERAHQLDALVARAKDERDGLQRDKHVLEHKLNQAEEQLEQLGIHLEATRVQNQAELDASHKAELEVHAQELRALADLVSSTEEARVCAEEETRQLQLQVNELRAERECSRENEALLVASIRSKDQICESLGQDNTSLRAEVETLRAEAAATLKARDLATQIKDIMDEKTSLNLEKTQLLARVKELEQAVKEYEERGQGTSLMRVGGSPPRPDDFGSQVVVIELGTWKIRCGSVSEHGIVEQGVPFADIPCFVARPKNVQADLRAIVQNAGLHAGEMYSRFRRDGFFLGRDAWYCCHEHPDPVLRGSLKLESPFQRGSLLRHQDLAALIAWTLASVQIDASSTPLIVTFKSTSTVKERQHLLEALFEHCDCSMVRLFDEAYLLSEVAELTTGIIIDVGYDHTRVVMLYEGMIVDSSTKTSPVGGQDLTEYMSDMLLSCNNETFSTSVPRRQQEAARVIKERHCYVAADFEAEVERYGKFEREVVDVMSWKRQVTGAGGDPRIEGSSGGGRLGDGALRVTETLVQDGKELILTIGKERFHCPELLFRPHLHAAAKHVKGLSDLVLECLKTQPADEWVSWLENIVIAGGSARTRGLCERVTKDIRSRLPAKFAGYVRVRTVEDTAIEGSGSAVWRGAARLTPRLLSNEQAWLSVETYKEIGSAAAAQDLRYVGAI